MYNEISFLFDVTNKIKNYSTTTTNQDIFNINDVKKVERVNNKLKDGKIQRISPPSGNDIKTHLQNTSYIDGNNDKNPYSLLLEKFANIPSMKLVPADFAYLTDLGVYPINRLIILRRYAEGVVVRNNLNDIDAEPISTIVGWVSDKEEKMFSITFSERWKNSTELFWNSIAGIIKDETMIDVSNSIPAPGWAQGFLYQFLAKSGYASDTIEPGEIPIGDPDVLKESMTRETESQGLESTFSFTLKTSYEQKYIQGVDSGSAMLDIINNSLRMGTSDMKYMLGGKTKDLMTTVSGGASEWVATIKEIVKSFADTTLEMIKKTGESTAIAVNLISGKEDKVNDVANIISDALDAAIKRYRWKLRGSLGVTTGEPTTPWHLTIGNPRNPIVSVGNMIVEGTLDFGNEMGFNDMPTQIDATYVVKLGRSLGKNEIVDILDNTYSREYSNVKAGDVVVEQNQTTQTDGNIPTPYQTVDENGAVVTNFATATSSQNPPNTPSWQGPPFTIPDENTTNPNEPIVVGIGNDAVSTRQPF